MAEKLELLDVKTVIEPVLRPHTERVVRDSVWYAELLDLSPDGRYTSIEDGDRTVLFCCERVFVHAEDGGHVSVENPRRGFLGIVLEPQIPVT
jgi:hypothetical protein